MRQKAFTLLELLVVLFIVSTLLVVLTVSLGGRLADARHVRIDSDLAILLAAGEQYAQRHPGENLDGQVPLIEEGLLRKPLESPIAGGHYHITVAEGVVRAQLLKGEVVYERGDYRAEKISTRLYLN